MCHCNTKFILFTLFFHKQGVRYTMPLADEDSDSDGEGEEKMEDTSASRWLNSIGLPTSEHLVNSTLPGPGRGDPDTIKLYPLSIVLMSGWYSFRECKLRACVWGEGKYK